MMENIVSCLQQGKLCDQYAIFGHCDDNPAPANNVNRQLFGDADTDSIGSFGVGNLSSIEIDSQELPGLFDSPPSSQDDGT